MAEVLAALATQDGISVYQSIKEYAGHAFVIWAKSVLLNSPIRDLLSSIKSNFQRGEANAESVIDFVDRSKKKKWDDGAGGGGRWLF